MVIWSLFIARFNRVRSCAKVFQHCIEKKKYSEKQFDIYNRCITMTTYTLCTFQSLLYQDSSYRMKPLHSRYTSALQGINSASKKNWTTFTQHVVRIRKKNKTRHCCTLWIRPSHTLRIMTKERGAVTKMVCCFSTTLIW